MEGGGGWVVSSCGKIEGSAEITISKGNVGDGCTFENPSSGFIDVDIDWYSISF